MKRMLQLTFFAVAMGLLFGSFEPVEAQGYYSQTRGFAGDDEYRPRYRSKRPRIKSSSAPKRISPRRARARARSARLGRARNRYIKRRNRKAARRNVGSLNKRKVASLKRQVIGRKSKVRSGKKSQKGPVQVVVSLAKQRVSIYKGGKVIASARVSTGRSGHRTPAGVFSIIQKRKKHFSNLYNDAPMPFMQRITWSGLALHAGNVSRPYQSHGCIRMPYGFARELFKSTRMGAHVIIASGSSPLQPITHMSLIQPMASGSILASNGVRTAALNENTSGDVGAPLLERSGIQGFVKPTVVATRHLAKKKREYQHAVADGPKFEVALEQAQKQFAEQKTLLVAARKLSLTAQKRLRKPRYIVRKIKRSRGPRLRAYNKAQWRANWAKEIIQKRIDIPKYAGKWMEMAVARTHTRDAYALKVKARLDNVTERLDEATVVLDQLTKEASNARAFATKRHVDLREATRLLKKARSEYAASKRRIVAQDKQVKVAIAGVKRAKAREKLPLRIFITPQTGAERIKTAQRLLAEIGYEPGLADGNVGKNTRVAINAFQRELNVEVTGKVSDKLIEDLHNRAGRPQAKSGHMYVRQGFVNLFDAPVGVIDPGKPLGTHLYTAMYFEKGAGSAQWTAVTVKNASRKYSKKRRGKKSRKRSSAALATVSAQQALDRISLPAPVRRQLSMLLTPGSSMVISDKGMSHETGKGTDFVVLTR